MTLEFQRKWNSEKIKAMTLEEYTSVGEKERQDFSYWIESRLDEIGSIWGGSAFKFGIYKCLSDNGDREKRLPGNTNFSFKGIKGETLLLKLDEIGICASTGSACSSGVEAPSHVLTAIGLSNELANSSLRVTFGEENTKEDASYLIKNLIEIVGNLRKNK